MHEQLSINHQGYVNPLNGNPIKWSNNSNNSSAVPTNCLNVLDHFVEYCTSNVSTLLPGTKPLRRLEVQQGQNEIENNMQKLNPEINMKNYGNFERVY